MIQKNLRSLKTSDRRDEILMEVDGWKWDALLLSETWRPIKSRDVGVNTRSHIHECWKVRKQSRRRNLAEENEAKKDSVDGVH